MFPADVPFHHVRLHVDAPELADVGAQTFSALLNSGVSLVAGTEVAIAVGSRGITNLASVVARIAAWVRSQGATPFIVPAMGSHGGATGPGQAEVIASYGITAESIGCEIRSSMDVVELDRGDSPVPVVMDAHAARAAGVILVNRVKPHTDFHGPYESGLVKMAAIGLGKQVAADAIHAHGVRGLREIMPLVGRRVLDSGRVLLGVALVENAREGTLAVEAIPAARIAAREPALLELAARHLPALPVSALDVLLVDRMGKDISGVGLDTNVIGRVLINGQPDAASPVISMIGCHSLTPASHGNATGMGLADVVTRTFADSIDHAATRTNIVTSGFLLRGKLPVVADDAAQLWELCLRGAGVVDVSTVRALRIVDTLHCDALWVSDAVFAELAPRSDVELLASGLRLHDETRSLRPFAGGGNAA